MPNGNGRKRRRRKLLFGGAGAVVLAAIALIAARSSSKEIDPSRLATVERGDVARSVVATGKIQPLAKVQVKSKASGIVKRLDVDYGDRVRQGQLLAELDKEQLEWATGYDDKKNFCYRCSVRRSGMGYADRELVWNYKYNSITILDRKWNSMVEWNGVKLIGSSQTNAIYSIGGFNDNGTAIQQRTEFPWWSVGEEFNVSFRFLYLNLVQWGQYSPQVDMFIDGSQLAMTVDLAGGIDWAAGAWATDAGSYFITADIPLRKSNGVNYKGRYFKMKTSHDGLDQPLSWIDASLIFSRTKELYRGAGVSTLEGMGL